MLKVNQKCSTGIFFKSLDKKNDDTTVSKNNTRSIKSIYDNNKLSLAFSGLYFGSTDLQKTNSKSLEEIKNQVLQGSYLGRNISDRRNDPQSEKSDQIEFADILTEYNIQFIDELFTAKNSEKSSYESEYKYSVNQIKNILTVLKDENLSIYRELTNNEITRFKPQDIVNILWGLKRCKLDLALKNELFNKLLNAKTDSLNTEDNKYRFNGEAISYVLEYLNNHNLKYFYILLDAKDETDNSYRFNGNSLGKIVSCINPNNEKYFNKLLNAKLETNPLETKTYRFSGEGIGEIFFALYEKKDDADFFKILFNATSIDGKTYRFRDKELGKILFMTSKDNSQFLTKVLEAKDGLNYRFTQVNNIKSLLSIINQYKNIDDFSFVLNQKQPDNQQYRFDEYEIVKYSKLFNYTLPHKKILEEKNIYSLTPKEKLCLINLYRNAGIRIFDEIRGLNINSPLIPRTEDERKILQQNIIASLFNLKIPSLPSKSIDKVNKALNNLENSLKKFDLSAYNNGLPISFSRTDFLNEINKNTSALCQSDKGLALEYYNISLRSDGIGYPSSANVNDQSLESILSTATEKEALRNAIVDLKSTVDKYTINNKFMITLPDNPVLAEEINTSLNVIGETFPEFITTVGKPETHGSTLDIHLLKVLQKVVRSDEFNALSSKDKKIGILSTLFHDISKNEGKDADIYHAENSALEVFKLMKRLNLSDREAERVYNLVLNHHWVEKLIDGNKKLRDLVFDFRRPADAEISKILSRADIEAGGNQFYIDNFNKNYISVIDELISQIKKTHSTGIFLPQTQIPRASNIKGIETLKLGANDKLTQNKVININNDTDFESLGFDKGTKYDNFYALIHAVEPNKEDVIMDISYASKEGNDGVFSTSYITPENFKTYSDRKYAFVFDVDSNNISLASNINLGSGTFKNINDFKDLLFNDNKYQGKDHLYGRDLFSNKVKELIKQKNPDLTHQKVEETYLKLYQRLANCQSLTDISNTSLQKLIAQALKESILTNEINNEIVVYAPKPKALITQEPAETIPYYLRKYAEDNDLPILLLSK